MDQRSDRSRLPGLCRRHRGRNHHLRDLPQPLLRVHAAAILPQDRIRESPAGEPYAIPADRNDHCPHRLDHLRVDGGEAGALDLPPDRSGRVLGRDADGVHLHPDVHRGHVRGIQCQRSGCGDTRAMYDIVRFLGHRVSVV